MTNGPILLGHRGARGQASAPENSIAAFDLALSEGCDGFEFDVRLSSDGEVVVCHDAIVRGREVSQTPSHKLELPLLRDVLVRYQYSAFLDVELKVSGLESAMRELVRQHTPVRGCVVSSFLPEVLVALGPIEATISLGLICETKKQLAQWTGLPVEYVVLQHRLLSRDAVAEFKRRGKKIMVWTVNQALQMRRFADWGVDGIISDKPAALVSQLR